MEKRRVVHGANTAGIERLLAGQFEEDSRSEYLCCSSMECSSFLDRDILFLVEGEVLREYSGDVGWVGGTPKNTPYDEIHLAPQYEVVGIDSRTDLTKAQIAVFCAAELCHYNISSWEVPEGAWDYEWITEMDEEEFEELREEYHI